MSGTTMGFIAWALIIFCAVNVLAIYLASRGVIGLNRVMFIRGVPLLRSSPQAWKVGHRAMLVPAALTVLPVLALAVSAWGDRSLFSWFVLPAVLFITAMSFVCAYRARKAIEEMDPVNYQ